MTTQTEGPSTTDSASRILDIAERRMRRVGYNAVSFRDIASEMGIRSASLHYHFPKKEDLGVALVRRYADNFLRRLNAESDATAAPEDKLSAFVDLYRYALIEQRLVCLCAVLGAEAPGLPTSVAAEVEHFFDQNIAWLVDCYEAAGVKSANQEATSTLALLQGAMVVSSVKNDFDIFDAAARSVRENFGRFTA